MMNKYERLKGDLVAVGSGSMKCFGNSMLPILKNPSVCHYERQDEYKVGDIVFCKVKGRYIDAHLITAREQKAGEWFYRISNNHGFDNGWTRIVYGRVVKSIAPDGTEKCHN